MDFDNDRRTQDLLSAPGFLFLGFTSFYVVFILCFDSKKRFFVKYDSKTDQALSGPNIEMQDRCSFDHCNLLQIIQCYDSWLHL